MSRRRVGRRVLLALSALSVLILTCQSVIAGGTNTPPTNHPATTWICKISPKSLLEMFVKSSYTGLSARQRSSLPSVANASQVAWHAWKRVCIRPAEIRVIKQYGAANFSLGSYTNPSKTGRGQFFLYFSEYGGNWKGGYSFTYRVNLWSGVIKGPLP